MHTPKQIIGKIIPFFQDLPMKIAEKRIIQEITEIRIFSSKNKRIVNSKSNYFDIGVSVEKFRELGKPVFKTFIYEIDEFTLDRQTHERFHIDYDVYKGDFVMINLDMNFQLYIEKNEIYSLKYIELITKSDTWTNILSFLKNKDIKNVFKSYLSKEIYNSCLFVLRERDLKRKLSDQMKYKVPIAKEVYSKSIKVIINKLETVIPPDYLSEVQLEFPKKITFDTRLRLDAMAILLTLKEKKLYTKVTGKMCDFNGSLLRKGLRRFLTNFETSLVMKEISFEANNSTKGILLIALGRVNVLSALVRKQKNMSCFYNTIMSADSLYFYGDYMTPNLFMKNLESVPFWYKRVVDVGNIFINKGVLNKIGRSKSVNHLPVRVPDVSLLEEKVSSTKDKRILFNFIFGVMKELWIISWSNWGDRHNLKCSIVEDVCRMFYNTGTIITFTTFYDQVNKDIEAKCSCSNYINDKDFFETYRYRNCVNDLTMILFFNEVRTYKEFEKIFKISFVEKVNEDILHQIYESYADILNMLLESVTIYDEKMPIHIRLSKILLCENIPDSVEKLRIFVNQNPNIFKGFNYIVKTNVILRNIEAMSFFRSVDFVSPLDGNLISIYRIFVNEN
jgi:hypothetical protein